MVWLPRPRIEIGDSLAYAWVPASSPHLLPQVGWLHSKSLSILYFQNSSHKSYQFGIEFPPSGSNLGNNRTIILAITSLFLGIVDRTAPRLLLLGSWKFCLIWLWSHCSVFFDGESVIEWSRCLCWSRPEWLVFWKWKRAHWWWYYERLIFTPAIAFSTPRSSDSL